MIVPSAARLVLIMFLVAACANTPPVVPVASPAATPAGIGSAAPPPSPQPPSPDSNPVPTASSASGWPFIGVASEPVFGPDGTVYLLTSEGDRQVGDEQSLVALDAAGHVRAGWPIETPEGSGFKTPAAGPGGSVYVEECGTAAVGCRVHRLGTDGQEPPGWPFEVPPSVVCPMSDACVSRLILGSQDTVYLMSWHKANRQTQILAIDATGRVKPGRWPVALDESYGWGSTPQLGSDGTLFIDTKPGADDGPSALWALAPDGSLRPGWPIPIAEPGGFQPGPNGTTVIVSYEPLLDPAQGGLDSDASRTVFSVVGPDGRTLPGWPRGSKGYASGPVVDSDGTIYYRSATDKVYAHDVAGEVKAGWPVAMPPDSRIYGPYPGSGGTAYFLTTEVVAIFPDGTQWRYRPAGPLTWPCSDQDCPPYAVAPAFGSGGVVYIAVNHEDSIEIVALDHRGLPIRGWPYRLRIDAPDVEVPSLTVSPDGRLYARRGTTIVALDAHGRLSE